MIRISGCKCCRLVEMGAIGVVGADRECDRYGTKGLRVCDVSTFGRLPDVNLVGPVYAHAELGASVIRKDYGDE